MMLSFKKIINNYFSMDIMISSTIIKNINIYQKKYPNQSVQPKYFNNMKVDSDKFRENYKSQK